MIRVNSVKDAWKVANQLFPTDYAKDEKLSQRAGYPIYCSTLLGCNSWISDLGTSLELNIEDGKKNSTTRIFIEDEPVVLEKITFFNKTLALIK